MGDGLIQEYKEIKDIPQHVKNKEYKKAAEQVGDIEKMTFLSALWILSGRGVFSGVIVKFFKKMRPSAFEMGNRGLDLVVYLDIEASLEDVIEEVGLVYNSYTLKTNSIEQIKEFLTANFPTYCKLRKTQIPSPIPA